MIEPTQEDIGRAVIYTGNKYPGGKLEDGVIVSFNSHGVFVRYKNEWQSKSTSRKDLEWVVNGSSSVPEFPEHAWREILEFRVWLRQAMAADPGWAPNYARMIELVDQIERGVNGERA